MFAHNPLNQQNHEIRLIRLIFPDDGGHIDPQARITLELWHASMNDNLPYAALSYVWGDSRDTIDIELNGASFPVSFNLHAGLQQLRQNEVRSWLWVGI